MIDLRLIYGTRQKETLVLAGLSLLARSTHRAFVLTRRAFVSFGLLFLSDYFSFLASSSRADASSLRLLARTRVSL